MPAGPSLVDMLANAAFYYGTATMLGDNCAAEAPPCDFQTAKANFYAAAKAGLHSTIVWKDKPVSVRTLILDTLLPMAKEGLERLGIDSADVIYYLEIIGERTRSGRNGAQWQIDYAKKHGRDMQKLTEAYWRCQQTGEPVHTWEIP